MKMENFGLKMGIIDITQLKMLNKMLRVDLEIKDKPIRKILNMKKL